jgi:hypothetical protein
MRCLSCHTVVADSDRRCISCGAPVRNAAYGQRTESKPFFAVAFMIAGAVGYNVVHPPSQSVAMNGGKINMEHVMWAGVVGGICAAVGGLLDALLGGERRKREAQAPAVTLQQFTVRPSILDSTPSIRPKRAETSPPPRG